jgi:hypothetical protein
VSDLLVVVEKLLPNKLVARGVDRMESVCVRVRAALKAQEAQLAARPTRRRQTSFAAPEAADRRHLAVVGG